MVFTVTPLYALALGLIFLILFMRVSSVRSDAKISYGYGGNALLLQRMRQHGNFIEWVPFVLILMILAEGMGAPALYIHISGVLLVVGRIAHPFGLKPDNAGHPLRYVGNGTNMLATANAMVCIAVNLFNP
ncbi:MAG: MAPEG family protein [Paracoccaceae bacterium]